MPNNFLSSGVYGCVYHPPYDCQGKPINDKKYVSKIVKADFTAKTEFSVGKILQKDGFITVTESCNIEQKDLARSSMLPNCKLLKKDPKLEKKYVIMKSEYIKSTELASYLKKNATEKLIMQAYFLICERIDSMLTVGIVHHDLHFGNILFDNTKLYVIDFGLSLIQQKFYIKNKPNYAYLKEAIFKYSPSWNYWSLEYHFLCYLIHEGKLSKPIIEHTINYYLSKHRVLKLWGNEFLSKYQRSAIAYFMKYDGQQIDDVVMDLLKTSSTWDLYKTALHFMEIYDTTQLNVTAFKTLLMIMVHPIPEYRPTQSEMKEFNAILMNSHKFENKKTTGHFSKELSKNLKNTILASKAYAT